jgi:hypothetical protein
MAQLDQPEYELACHQGYSLGWLLYVSTKEQGDYHLVPDNDTFQHVLSRDCGCRPEDDPTADDYVFGHKAQDGRECYERGDRQLN